MKRTLFPLFAVAATGAALVSVPASAQTNSNGYVIYTQNYDGTVLTPTGTSGGPGRAAVAAGSSVTIKAPGSANYNAAAQSAAATVTLAGTKQTMGSTAFTNVANSGNQAENLAWQYTPTTTGPGLERYTTSGSINARPIVDLASVVSFNMFVASSAPNATVNVTLEVEDHNDTFYNADLPTGPSTLITAAAPAPADVLGMRGSDSSDTEVWIIGGQGSTKSNGFPADGKSVVSGSWQTVTFNLQSDPRLQLLGTTGYATSGLGSIYGMDFVPVNPVSGQSYSVYIDDLTIGGMAVAATPEPSGWAGMGMGAALLLGLAVRARRKQMGGEAVTGWGV